MHTHHATFFGCVAQHAASPSVLTLAHPARSGPPFPTSCRRFEDVAALLSFLSRTYTDASAAGIQTAPDEEVPLQLPGGVAFSAAAAHHLASC